MAVLVNLFTASLVLCGAVEAFRTSYTLPQLRELASQSGQLRANRARDIDPSLLYPEYNLSVPIDHFHNDSLYEPHSNGSFNLRYWFDASHYKKGGPVIVLQSGETSGVGRLPFLQKGIVAQLAQVTGGIGVILEHRYYGTSWPVDDLSIENLRFLSTDQAIADMVYFAKNVVFDGLEDLDLTAPKTPYIAYGGSYAGAFVAILRKAYPDVYWGSISSSGVTEAIYDYWEYYEAARLFAPQGCVLATQKLTNVVDNILIGKNGTEYVQRLKTAFGLGNLTRSDDFASAISGGIAGLQSTNWDPAENSTDFGVYCDTISSTTLLYPNVESLTAEAAELIDVGGWGNESQTLVPQLLNYIGYINETSVSRCAQSNQTQDECYTNYDSDFYRQDDIGQDWRSWPWQYCTEWGYLQTGSGVPADILPLISRLIDLNFTSVVCREAFNITQPSAIGRINKWGGFGISYPRLAIVDGERDPWRQACPHAIGQPDRPSTASEPYILIAGGVHHWDENGLFPNETTPELPPLPVADTQKTEAMFVQEWMLEWQLHYMNENEKKPLEL
ncbi:Peptidase S28 [Pleurostoma richardsiae]|uniref:Peptidase S28 n=1 Tax=Pleurostoma richardsiae TaxID=41990 RepID=A0AA38RF27_9PEZI|nr:Peptidase S28 [Pleurostoma richardsiae]